MNEEKSETGTIPIRVAILEDWRRGTADPWINESKDFHVEMRQFQNQLIGGQKEAARIRDEQHHANTLRLNLVIVIGTLLLALAAWATFFRGDNTHTWLRFPFNYHNLGPVLSLWRNHPHDSENSPVATYYLERMNP